jgi:hypothetical protein
VAGTAIVAVKLVHTAAFFAVGGCLAYFLGTGLRRQSDRRALLSGAVVAGEAAVYAVNGMTCPLTDVAERLGADSGSVSDIYLPHWLVDHLAEITAPLFAEAVVLHARNLARSGPAPG